MKNDANDKYILIADSATWMSVHKGWIFAEAAKKFGFKTIRVAPDARLSWQEDIFILDPLMSSQVLVEKLKKYKNQVAYILPAFDFASTLLAPVAKALEIPFLDVFTAQHLGSKSALANFLSAQKLETPRTWLVDSSAGFKQIPDDIKLVVKANVSTGSLRKHDWDYRTFANKTALLAYLEEAGQTKAFIVNNQNNERYQSVVQEYIEAERFLDVHVVFAQSGKFKVYLIGEFSTHPNELQIVESKSAENLSEEAHQQIHRFVELLSRVGCENMLANLQFALKNDRLYLFDLNLRVAGVWSYLHKMMMPDFPFQALSFFAGQSADFQVRAPYYLKTPYYLEAGKTLESFQAPLNVDDSVLLAYMDHLVPGYKVPELQNSIQPSPQIFAVGNSSTECRDKIQNILNSTQVRYRS